jgi:hypothetical protein
MRGSLAHSAHRTFFLRYGSAIALPQPRRLTEQEGCAAVISLRLDTRSIVRLPSRRAHNSLVVKNSISSISLLSFRFYK